MQWKGFFLFFVMWKTFAQCFHRNKKSPIHAVAQIGTKIQWRFHPTYLLPTSSVSQKKVSHFDDNGVGRAGLVPLRDGGSKGYLRYFQPGKVNFSSFFL